MSVGRTGLHVQAEFRDFVVIDEGHVVVLHVKRVTRRTRNFLGDKSGSYLGQFLAVSFLMARRVWGRG